MSYTPSNANIQNPAFVNALQAMRNYILSHHALAETMRMNGINTSEQLEIIYKRGDGPSGLEQSIVGTSIVGWYAIPRVTITINSNPHQSIQQFHADMSYEPILFPLLLPSGLGGFCRHQYGTTTSTSGKIFPTIHSFTKRVLYQRMLDCCIIPQVQEQWLLDSLSRAEGVRAAQIVHNTNVNSARAKRIASLPQLANMTSFCNATSVGHHWTIPSSISQSQGYPR
jgi:hypothetical protein